MKKQQKIPTYRIARAGQGFVIVDQDGVALTHEDVWVITIRKLEQMLRKELGI